MDSPSSSAMLSCRIFSQAAASSDRGMESVTTTSSSWDLAILSTAPPDKGKEQAILRDVQMHPYKPRVLHVDFQRVSATEKIRIAVPLHFLGGEECPGVYNDAGIESHLINEVEVECLPADLPEFLEIDISHLNMHESSKLSDIKVPVDVILTALAHEGEDLPVATIMAPQREEVEEVEEEDIEGVEGETPEGEESEPEEEE